MIGDLIGEWIKGILIDGIMGNLSGLFNTVNTKVGEIASDVGSTPQDWNGGIFSMLQNLSETVIVPIAAAILALVMCYELIDMIVEKNNMHDFDSSMFFRWIFKSAFAILIVTNTWNIVMGVFDATQQVVNQSAGVIIGDTSIDFDTLLPDLESRLEAMDIVVFFVVVLLGGGAALYFLKFKKEKADTTGNDDLAEYDFGEDEDDEDETPEPNEDMTSEDGNTEDEV